MAKPNKKQQCSKMPKVAGYKAICEKGVELPCGEQHHFMYAVCEKTGEETGVLCDCWKEVKQRSHK